MHRKVELNIEGKSNVNYTNSSDSFILHDYLDCFIYITLKFKNLLIYKK